MSPPFRRMFAISLVLSPLLILSYIRPSASQSLYERYSKYLYDLERFELKIVEQLTQATLTTQEFTNGSAVPPLVEKYLKDFYEANGFKRALDAITKADMMDSNTPICTYRLIRRLLSSLQDLVSNEYFSLAFSETADEIQRFFQVTPWPTDEDIEKAATAILRMQQVYDLRAERLANGWISKSWTHCTLNSKHCKEIAEIAIKSEEYSFAVEWAELGKEKALMDKKISAQAADFLVWRAIEMHNQGIGSRAAQEPRFFTRKIRHEVPEDSKSVRRRRNVLYELYKGRKEIDFKEIAFWGLCSGENFQDEEERSKLFCWFEYKIHPTFTIGPVKMEFLARNPDIIQMHGVLNEKEIESLKLDSIGTSRSSEGNLNGKIERLTGLNVESGSSEGMQAASYARGGKYEPHMDTERRMKGERIATFMAYLNSVDEGGSTVFTSLGIAAKPSKGSAVFWHNMYLDGEEDLQTYHGGCPVLIGEKWVANKWITSLDQFLIRKCSLNPKERYRFPVNNVVFPLPNDFNGGSEVVLKAEASSGNPKTPKYSYLAPQELRALAQLELRVYPLIKSLYRKYRNRTIGVYTQEKDKTIRLVKLYLKDFEDSALGAVSLGSSAYQTQKISHNPLSAYKMIFRFLFYLQTWIKVKPTAGAGSKLLSEISRVISEVYEVSDGPVFKDLESAMFSIVNIHFNYDLASKEISKGLVAGVETRVYLNARDCYRIGRHGVAKGFYTTGIEWLQHALHLVQNTSDDSIKYEDVHDALITAEISHDEGIYKIENESDDSKFFLKPISETRELSQRITRKSIQYEELERKNWTFTKFSATCNGKALPMTSEVSELFCWHEHEIHPSYKIGPVKAELLWMEKLEVVQFHEIISGREIESLKNLTRHQSVHYSDDAARNFRIQRLTKYIKSTPSVLKLMQRLTGLETDPIHGEIPMIVSAYSPGSYFGGHMDGTYNSVASFMIYMWRRVGKLHFTMLVRSLAQQGALQFSGIIVLAVVPLTYFPSMGAVPLSLERSGVS